GEKDPRCWDKVLEEELSPRGEEDLKYERGILEKIWNPKEENNPLERSGIR
ncbi:unnamed protein product, partial [Dovyalis caffra]